MVNVLRLNDVRLRFTLSIIDLVSCFGNDVHLIVQIKWISCLYRKDPEVKLRWSREFIVWDGPRFP